MNLVVIYNRNLHLFRLFVLLLTSFQGTCDGKNSFVAPHAHFEYQLDLLFKSSQDLEQQNFRIGLVFIDVFSYTY